MCVCVFVRVVFSVHGRDHKRLAGLPTESRQTDRRVEEDGEEIYLERLSGVFRARQQTDCGRTTFHICPENHLLPALKASVLESVFRRVLLVEDSGGAASARSSHV